MDVKSRPRPNASTSQPLPKPRTISLSQTQSASLLTQLHATSKPRAVSYAGLARSELDTSNTSQTGSSVKEEDKNSQQDLISFHSPEKPKNDILELFNNFSSSSSLVLPPSASNTQGTSRMPSSYGPLFSSQHVQRGPSSNLSTYQGAVASTVSTSNWLGLVQDGPAYPNYNSSLSSVPYQPVLSQQQQSVPGNFSFLNLSAAGPLVPVTQSSSTSHPGPRLPRRCPTLDISHRTLMGQLSTSHSASSTPILSPIASDNTNSSLGVLGNKPKGDDLIDLGKEPVSVDDADSAELRDSVLDVFDPIVLKAKEEESRKKSSVISAHKRDYGENLSSGEVKLSKEAHELLQLKEKKKSVNEDEMSYYEQVDPFEYMHPGASSTRSDPVYDIYDGLVSPGAVGGETFDLPPPLPPRTGARESEAEVQKSPRYKTQKKRVDVVSLIYFLPSVFTYESYV